MHYLLVSVVFPFGYSFNTLEPVSLCEALGVSTFGCEKLDIVNHLNHIYHSSRSQCQGEIWGDGKCLVNCTILYKWGGGLKERGLI